jgi:hypothetical protein
VTTYYSIVIEQLVAPGMLSIERVCLVAAGLLTIANGTVTATRPFLEPSVRSS